ncbi:hypothetical protein KUCAC02_003389 [Chaenocephalus aceratus]|uniref:Uncharacterized protein n=1 Tax=Chaenocephalus aceratus TaxID=36190 RepID=A0ACB9WLG2_CHAAC|nr:hypothetical protein KUCAC02_003389 [Chaenocephalus aceratus]
MKEKKDFSAFLNEITRQVLSPMRLSTLGVKDAKKTYSPGHVSVRSSRASKPEKHKQPRSRLASRTSVTSSKFSHTSKHSSRLSHSQEHQRHHSTDSPLNLSRSQSPSSEHYHHRHQGHHHSLVIIIITMVNATPIDITIITKPTTTQVITMVIMVTHPVTITMVTIITGTITAQTHTMESITV